MAQRAEPRLQAGSARSHIALGVICLIAVAPRLYTQLLHPSIVYADEVFQYLEPAHRLVTGQGLTPWEYVVGARSWLIPGVLAAVLSAGRLFSAMPSAQLAAATLFMTALAVAGVAAAFSLGLRVGFRHACLAGLVSAIWCELVYFSPHVLADTLCADTLILAFAVAAGAREARISRSFWAGVLFGLTVALRIQLAPAVAIAVLGVCSKLSQSRRLAFLAGGFLAVLILGIVDEITLGAPFRSVFVYLLTNRAGVADSFGTSPAIYYALMELATWGAFAPVVVVTGAIGARRLPLMALCTAVILASFTLVAHKEPRFIYPALPLLVCLCGVGSADLAGWAAGWIGARTSLRTRAIGRWTWALTAAGALAWIAASLDASARPPMRARWTQEAALIGAYRLINADPHACGVGVVPASRWWLAGRVRVRDDLRLYQTPSGPNAGSPAYNYVIATDTLAAPAPALMGYTRVACVGASCVYRRPGPCEAAAACELPAPPPRGVRQVIERLGLVTPAQERRAGWRARPGCLDAAALVSGGKAL